MSRKGFARKRSRLHFAPCPDILTVLSSLFGVMARLRSRQSPFRIPVEARNISLVQTAQGGPEVHPAPSSIGTGVLYGL